MILTITILSVTVLLLLLTLLLCVIGLIDVRSRCEFAIDTLRHKEEILCRIRTLVHQKFAYNLPYSDKYLILEEERVRQQSQEQK